MEWYYASNGQQQGPVSQEQLIELFKKGEVKTSDLVWNESMTDWVAFGNVPGLNQGAAVPDQVQPTPSAGVAQGEGPAPAAAGSVVAASAGTVSALPPAGGENIPTYLWQSIVCMVLCCLPFTLPFSIPALVFATKVGPAIALGQLDEAREASRKAKMWCWITFGVGLVGWILYIGIFVFAGIAEAGGM